jgi:hypothetical protein
MEEKDYIQLDAYFNGLLSDVERRAVEDRAALDPSFGAAFTQQQGMEQWLRQEPGRAAISAQTAALGRAFFQENTSENVVPVLRPNYRRRYLMSVAAALALVLAAVWFFSAPGGDFYAQYAQHSDLQLVLRGGNSTLYADAEKAFNAKQYAQALPLLQKIQASEPDNLTAALYLGICQIEAGDGAAARATLAPLAGGSSVFQADARWYTALSHLKDKNNAAAVSALKEIRLGEAHHREASELLDKLAK